MGRVEVTLKGAERLSLVCPAKQKSYLVKSQM